MMEDLMWEWIVNIFHFSKSEIYIFSRDEATLFEVVSVGWSDGRSVGPMVTSYFFGPLGATYAVYTALFSYSHPFNRRFNFLEIR